MGKQGMRIMLVIALASGLMVAVGLYRILSQGQTQSNRSVETVSVVLAREALTRGTVLSDSHLEMQSGAEGQLQKPLGSFSFPSELTGRVLKTEVAKGQPILDSMLAPKGDGVPLGVMVPPGMRGVIVHVDPQSNVESFLRVGDRVDVVLTLNDEDSGLTSSKILLQDAQVLAVPTAEEEVDPRRSSTEWVPVALAVTPQDAEKLSLATNVGTLQLLVRGYEDEVVAWTSGVTTDTLIPEGAAKSAREMIKDVDGQRSYRIVEVIKGKEKTQERFRTQPANAAGYIGGAR